MRLRIGSCRSKIFAGATGTVSTADTARLSAVATPSRRTLAHSSPPLADFSMHRTYRQTCMYTTEMNPFMESR